MSSLLEALAQTCRDQGSRLAVWARAAGTQVRFDELWERIEAAERELRVAPGERVAVATGNRLAFLELLFALRKAGAVPLAMDGSLPWRDKRALAERFGVRQLFHADEQAGEAVLGGRVRRLDLPPQAGSSGPELPAEIALVKLTSGSTGEPVGIALDEAALLAGVRQIGAGMELTAQDRVLIAIPLSHSYGFDNGVLSLAVLGTPLILESGFYPQSLVRALLEGEVTFFPAVPPMVRALSETEWPPGLPLRAVISAGGPLAAEFAERFEARTGLAVQQFYGSTETGGICFERAPRAPEAVGTVGHPLPGVEIDLSDDGVVRVRSAANFACYLGQEPRLDRSVTLADRGEWTPEGRLRLTGRVADLLNVAGRRVSATAIEGVLRRLPGVDEAAVVGVEDTLRGDRLVAFLVGSQEPVPASRLPQGLAARDVRWIERLPYSERGKLDRAMLRQWARER
jgi:long-chain acyl-CoA synthetase